jgi:hypothetical protein
MLESVRSQASRTVKKAYKLHIQVVEVVIDIAFDLIARLKISEGSTQPIGAGDQSA